MKPVRKRGASTTGKMMREYQRFQRFEQRFIDASVSALSVSSSRIDWFAQAKLVAWLWQSGKQSLSQSFV
jgi:hypothetical protein